MRYLTLAEVVELHRRLIDVDGGAVALRDLGALQSALAQPRATFEGTDLYASLEEKAAALMFSLIKNHPFADGNKRIGHAAADAFLMLNGLELIAAVDDSEKTVVGVAAGALSREALLAWIREHVRPLSGKS